MAKRPASLSEIEILSARIAAIRQRAVDEIDALLASSRLVIDETPAKAEKTVSGKLSKPRKARKTSRKSTPTPSRDRQTGVIYAGSGRRPNGYDPARAEPVPADA